MGNRFRISWAVLSALALTLLGAGGATAQTQTMKTDVLVFEVISVDGNNLVVRDQNGTRELTVPDDFRFTVDGKPMSVHDLTQGMKGTATVTTTTTVRPVYVTEVKKGVVMRQIGTSVSCPYRGRCPPLHAERPRQARCPDISWTASPFA